MSKETNPNGQEMTTETGNQTVDKIEEKVGLSQEQVDEIVKARVIRERADLLTELGVKSIEDAKAALEKGAAATNTLAQKEQEVALIKAGVKEDKFQEALALAKLKGDDVSLEDALKEVVEAYPVLSGKVQSFGKKPGEDSKNEKPKYSREFLVANQHIPYYRKLLEKGE